MTKLFSAQQEFYNQLTANDVHFLMNDIDNSNWHRLRIFFGLTVIYELLLVALVDLPALAIAQSGLIHGGPGAPLGAGEVPAVPLSFLVCHSAILVSSSLGLFWAFRFLTNKSKPRQTPKGWLGHPTLAPSLIPTIILIFLGAIAGLDQLRGGDITAFTINVVVASLLLYLRPPLGFLVFTPGFLLMLAGVLVFQKDVALRLANVVNGGIFYTAVLLLSAYMFNNQYRQLAKSLLLERATETIKDLSLHDELTGLFNRRAFLAIVKRELARMAREQRRSFLAIADIDHFKQLNDRYGHPAGDEFLRRVAAILGKATRVTDTLARWGGEEFIILIEGNDEGAHIVLERALGLVEADHLDYSGQEINCSISIGFTELNAAEDMAFDQAYHRADAALYQAKKEGRNRIVGPS